MINKDKYFMSLALVTSNQSKDPNTKVGSCIVKDDRVISMGWNGAPRGFPDEDVPLCTDMTADVIDLKYSYVVHSELNAILNFRGDLSSLTGATLYVTVFPCNLCAMALVQVGIKEVVYLNEYHRTNIFDTSKRILDKCGVKYRKVEL